MHITLPRARVLVLMAAAACSGAAHAQIASTFDSGLEGWTGTGGAVSWVASGGSPGGYLRQIDSLSTFMTVAAPSSFLGNLSGYLGGTISFDGRNLNGATADLPAPGPFFGTVTFAGTGGSFATALLAGTSGQPPADGAWHTYSAALTPLAWSGNLAAVLANVTGISVQLEFNNVIVESAGFDNFQVSAVPEESTFALLAGGLAAVGLIARRRRASRLG